jgi:CubicO group peptidase (beta-lactamase class C family)
MRRTILTLLGSVLVSAFVFAQAQQQPPPIQGGRGSRGAVPTGDPRYFPAKGDWERVDPATVGMDKAKLAEAIAYHEANQNNGDKDLAVATLQQFSNEAPYNALIGPTQARAAANGVVIRKGKVVAEWGDTNRADMTFSVTKTFLSTVVGLAYDRGLIKDLNARVATAMPKGVDLFTSEHNAPITWDHLLRQTSDWSGTLWTKPDWADRPPGCLGPNVQVTNVEQCVNRVKNVPGTVYEYNDTRVNVLALATLHVMKEELPSVLKAGIMDPIGASDTWHWEAYDNAVVTIDAKKMKSVTGGGHFGGGMFISAWDMARFGYLMANYGNWGGKQLISAKWLDMARTPGVNRNYGFMNWMLNSPGPGRNGGAPSSSRPSTPRASVTFEGNGANLIYVDWDNDLVVVVRWIRGSADPFFARVLAAIQR